MPKLSPIFQTLEDRLNPDTVEKHGPYESGKSHWLGKGYYFWDRNIQRAHWWGNRWYHNSSYMICQAEVIYQDESFFDLFNNQEHCDFFEQYARKLAQKYPKENLSAEYVLYHMRENGNFPFKIMRVESENCGGDSRYHFNGYSFLNTNKAIQLCIYDKSLIQDYHIVFPEIYVNPIG